MDRVVKGILITREDLVWEYLARFLSISSGLIILPLVLRLLSPDEVALNYIMLSISSFITLIDFGFSPQFARNVTYIYSGAVTMQKEGIDTIERKETIDYRLLVKLIQTARWIYSIMGIIVLFCMLTMGMSYIFHITNGFTTVENILLIWIINSISVALWIYYSYYGALLIGAGKIKEAKKVTVCNYAMKIICTYIFLWAGYGLLGLVIANLISPLLGRYVAYHFYFTNDMITQMKSYLITFREKLDLLKIVFYSSKKMGLCAIANYLLSGATVLLAGMYLPLNEIASYGLMVQILTVIHNVSGGMFEIYSSRFAYLQIIDSKKELFHDFSLTMCVYYIIYILGIGFVIFVGNNILDFIGSKTQLPSLYIFIIASVIWLLDGNLGNICQFIISKNNFVFVPSLMITSLGVIFCSYITLSWFHLGIIGLLLSKFLFQVVFNYWYWFVYVLRDLDESFRSFWIEGFKSIKLFFCGIWVKSCFL